MKEIITLVIFYMTRKMKDIITLIIFYLVWNSPVHQAHPTAIPVFLTLYVVILIIELTIKFLKD